MGIQEYIETLKRNTGMSFNHIQTLSDAIAGGNEEFMKSYLHGSYLRNFNNLDLKEDQQAIFDYLVQNLQGLIDQVGDGDLFQGACGSRIKTSHLLRAAEIYLGFANSLDN